MEKVMAIKRRAFLLFSFLLIISVILSLIEQLMIEIHSNLNIKKIFCFCFIV